MATTSEGEILASIRDLTHDGRGVADLDGRRVFVAGALPSEQVLIKPRRRRRRWADAELVSVIEPAAQRVEAGCQYFGTCGGCAVQHMDYAAQIQFKQNVVVEAFERIGGVVPEQWLEAIAGPQWNYRRRARLGVKYVDAKERVLVGFRERAAPYVTDMSSCPVLAKPMDLALAELATAIADSSLRTQLPQVEVAMGDLRGALVLRVLSRPTASDEILFQAFGERHGLDIYLQTGGPGTVAPLGDGIAPLSYKLEEFGVTLQFAPTDFVQINAVINARIVSDVLTFAREGSCDRVLDLFCGLGNFSLPLAQQAKSLLGVEGEAGLVARAAHNAQLNGIRNANFVTADLTAGGWGFLKEPWDLVMLDPPRTGAEAVVKEIAKLAPQRVAYVSCHPATLARDAQILTQSGYRLRTARVYDMFPQTYHIETMALFERKFLLADDSWRSHVHRSQRMSQGYLSRGELASIRVRVAGDDAWLNVKGAGLIAERDEYEYPIPLADALEMLAKLARPPLIDKTRHRVLHAGMEWEIDEFHGANAGLIVAEIEFERVGQEFEMPSWAGLEVTEFSRYYNVNLVRMPYCEWSADERSP